jgi:hypothetical protein
MTQYRLICTCHHNVMTGKITNGNLKFYIQIGGSLTSIKTQVKIYYSDKVMVFPGIKSGLVQEIITITINNFSIDEFVRTFKMEISNRIMSGWKLYVVDENEDILRLSKIAKDNVDSKITVKKSEKCLIL